MFDQLVSRTAGTRAAGAVQAWSQVENAACARRLAGMVTMLDDAYAASGSARREQWCLDNWGAVCAHVGAAQCITSGAASGFLLIAVALRERLPRVGALFHDGLIGLSLVRAVVERSRLVVDPEALKALDAALAQVLAGWAPMSVDRTEQTIDGFIAEIDPHAVRRVQSAARSRGIEVRYRDGSGMAEVYGTLYAVHAKAFEARLTELAATVCPADPRTRKQRRTDAIGALSHRADRLVCLCGSLDCPAAQLPPASGGVVIHVVAHQDTLTPPPADPQPTDPQLDGTPPSGTPSSGGDHHTDTDDTAVEGDTDAETGALADTSTEDEAPASADLPAPDGTPTADEAHDADTDLPAGDRAAEDCEALDGEHPALFTRPLREMTLAEALTDPDPGHLSTLAPAVIIGGVVLPGILARRAALTARIEPIVHPGQAPPEPGYRPSKALADFIRARDLTCRFPGCRVPATGCDIDHTIAWPHGPTQASNLKCVCRPNHLLKTFWGGDDGWRDRQDPDGTVHWTAPDGRTYVTDPGSRLLFPSLCTPTAPVIVVGDRPPAHTAGLTMPKRRTTRAQDRARRIDDEREDNRAATELETTQRDTQAEAQAQAEEPEHTTPWPDWDPDTLNQALQEDPPPF